MNDNNGTRGIHTQRSLDTTQCRRAAGLRHPSRNLLRGISCWTTYEDQEKISLGTPLDHVGTLNTEELENLFLARAHRPLSSRETRKSGVQSELQRFKHTRRERGVEGPQDDQGTLSITRANTQSIFRSFIQSLNKYITK